MAINLGSNKSIVTQAESTESASVVTNNLQMEPVEKFDIVVDQQQTKNELKNSEEIDKLTSTIDLDNMDTIITFGAKSAEEISKASDVILNGMDMSQLDNTSELMNVLKKIMDQFNFDEIRKEPGMLGKLFADMKKQLEKILNKYHTLGEEVDKIYVQLKGYQAEIVQSNRKLDLMFKSNVNYFHDLEKYVVAGEQACNEIQKAIDDKNAELQSSGNQEITFELAKLHEAFTQMQQRTEDLRSAEIVALESIPMIKSMEGNNYNLYRKIESAFIITLPVFKQALAQAILLKRQKIQAESMAALDKKTNEMLLMNAKNVSKISQQTARLASGSSIKADTLEEAWHTIVNGIDETKKIEEEARKQRMADKAKLEGIKEDFKKHFGAVTVNKR